MKAQLNKRPLCMCVYRIPISLGVEEEEGTLLSQPLFVKEKALRGGWGGGRGRVERGVSQNDRQLE